MVAYLHEYEIFRDDEVVKRHLFLSLDTILMIIETCAHSSTVYCALKVNHFDILKVKWEVHRNFSEVFEKISAKKNEEEILK